MTNPLGLLLDVANVGSVTYFTVRCPEGVLHAFTWGTAVASVAGLYGGNTFEAFRNYEWFAWAKRFSLFVIWFLYFCTWQMNLRAEQFPRTSLVTRRLLQLVLMMNVAEAAALMVLQGNLVAGIFCASLATIAPDWSFVDKGFRLCCAEQASCLGFPVPVSARWWTRAYYVVLSVCLCFHPLFKSLWVFVYISCLWPLFYQEVVSPGENVGVVFKIRVFVILVGGALLDMFVEDKTLEASTFIPPPPVKGLLMINLVSAAVLLVSFGALFAVDRLRAGKGGGAAGNREEEVGAECGVNDDCHKDGSEAPKVCV